MKKILLLSGAVVLTATLAGCRGGNSELSDWEQAIRQNYSGYEPPRRTYDRSSCRNTSTSGKVLVPSYDPTVLGSSYDAQWLNRKKADMVGEQAEMEELTEPGAMGKPSTQLPAPQDDPVPAKPEVAPEVKSEAKAPAKAEVKSEAKAPAKAEVKPEAKVEIPASADAPAKAGVKADAPAKAEVKSEAKAPAKVEAPAKAEVKAVVQAEKKTQPAAMQAPEPPDPTNSDIYTVQYGDTLGSVAQKFYGSARYANLLFKANSDIIKNPNKLKPGMRLIVPKL